MSDESLRALERAVKADPHDVGAKVALQRELARTGVSAQFRAELTSYADNGYYVFESVSPENKRDGYRSGQAQVLNGWKDVPLGTIVLVTLSHGLYYFFMPVAEPFNEGQSRV